jgi:hypothetical protein
MQVVGREWGVVVSAACREMFYNRRNSNRCDSETQEITDMSRGGGKKRKESATFD